ncbi:MAG: DUF5658 family protein [Dehalococcoidia bacterium]
MTLLAWMGLNSADALLTGLALHLGALEVNPFLGTIALGLSIERMLIIKTMFAVALGGVLWQRNRLRPLRMLNWAMIVIVMYNALIITYALT